MILAPKDKQAILCYLDQVRPLLSQTPEKEVDCEAMVLVSVTKVMKVLPSQKSDEVGYEARGEAYLAALDDIPYWAVDEAIRRWHRRECGSSYDYHWCPLPSELRAVSQVEVWRLKAHMRQLSNIANAVPLVEFSNEHREKMLGKLSQLFAETGSSLGITKQEAHDARERAARIVEEATRRRRAESNAG
jgi:hypothetical protein